MKIRPVGAELFYVDGRKDNAKPIIAFRNFLNVSKTGKMYKSVNKHIPDLDSEYFKS